MSRLKKHYTETLQPQLKATLGLSNTMQVPRIEKITVNMGVGDAVSDKKLLENAVADLTKLTGQKPQTTKSRKAIASFKLREGLAIGARVTLRGDRIFGPPHHDRDAPHPRLPWCEPAFLRRPW
jgi:large subunit ribosomal protein L5